MDIYLTMMYVTVEQELAIKNLFLTRGWLFTKPVLAGTTDTVGPIAGLEKPLKNSVHHTFKRKRKTMENLFNVTSSGNCLLSDSSSVCPQTSRNMDTETTQQHSETELEFLLDGKMCGKVSEEKETVTVIETANSPEKDDSQSSKETIVNTPGQGLNTGINNSAADRLSMCQKEKIIIKSEPEFYIEETGRSNSGFQTEVKHEANEVGEGLGEENEDIVDKGRSEMKGLYETSDGCFKDLYTSNQISMIPDVDIGWEHDKVTPCKKKNKESLSSEIFCKVCRKGFRSKYGLTRHMREHTGDLFKCPICDKGYKERYLLTDHLTTHAESGVPKHRCGECSKLFANKSNFVKHLRLHLEEPEVTQECIICRKLFQTRERLATHMRVYHRIYNSDDPNVHV